MTNNEKPTLNKTRLPEDIWAFNFQLPKSHLFQQKATVSKRQWWKFSAEQICPALKRLREYGKSMEDILNICCMKLKKCSQFRCLCCL